MVTRMLTKRPHTVEGLVLTSSPREGPVRLLILSSLCNPPTPNDSADPEPTHPPLTVVSTRRALCPHQLTTHILMCTTLTILTAQELCFVFCVAYMNRLAKAAVDRVNTLAFIHSRRNLWKNVNEGRQAGVPAAAPWTRPGGVGMGVHRRQAVSKKCSRTTVEEDSTVAREGLEKLQLEDQDLRPMVRYQVRGALEFSGEVMKRNHDVEASQVCYKDSDKVWLYNPQQKKGQSPKLQSPWEGPYTVMECLSDVTFRIIGRRKAQPKAPTTDDTRPYQTGDPGRTQDRIVPENPTMDQEEEHCCLLAELDVTEEGDRSEDVTEAAAPREDSVDIPKIMATVATGMTNALDSFQLWVTQKLKALEDKNSVSGEIS
ncbi:hypothetical protein Hamer_G023912 [Homarus americanus]|uniref:Uncharacterized protein n=1 Tax=Homarus americanus TaxID=6706 RepID=A0A8J5MW39_HOMAM|nr:hypothetical protein Hamer_G023912 [Homarus americanus]